MPVRAANDHREDSPISALRKPLIIAQGDFVLCRDTGLTMTTQDAEAYAKAHLELASTAPTAMMAEAHIRLASQAVRAIRSILRPPPPANAGSVALSEVAA